MSANVDRPEESQDHKLYGVQVGDFLKEAGDDVFPVALASTSQPPPRSGKSEDVFYSAGYPAVDPRVAANVPPRSPRRPQTSPRSPLASPGLVRKGGPKPSPREKPSPGHYEIGKKLPNLNTIEMATLPAERMDFIKRALSENVTPHIRNIGVKIPSWDARPRAATIGGGEDMRSFLRKARSGRRLGRPRADLDGEHSSLSQENVCEETLTALSTDNTPRQSQERLPTLANEPADKTRRGGDRESNFQLPDINVELID